MLSIASSHCILTISRDYPKIWQQRLGTETTRFNLEWLSRLNGGDTRVYLQTIITLEGRGKLAANEECFMQYDMKKNKQRSNLMGRQSVS